jgi:hypothetical protein
VLFFAYFLWRSKESKCRPAQGSMKIKYKANIKSAKTRAEESPEAQANLNRCPAQGSKKIAKPKWNARRHAQKKKPPNDGGKHTPKKRG